MEKLRRLVGPNPDARAVSRGVKKLLREAIQGEQVLLSIGDILDRLMQGQEPSPDGGPPLPLDSERIAALKGAMDGHFKLLNKVLPDLRSVELTGADGEALIPKAEVSNIELAARLLYLARSAGVTVDAEVEEAEDEGLDFLK